MGRPAELDRTATYNAGLVGEGTGKFTLGNHNETMHGHRLDRQFRGGLRGIRIYRSLLSGRDAMHLEQIRKVPTD